MCRRRQGQQEYCLASKKIPAEVRQSRARIRLRCIQLYNLFQTGFRSVSGNYGSCVLSSISSSYSQVGLMAIRVRGIVVAIVAAPQSQVTSLVRWQEAIAVKALVTMTQGWMDRERWQSLVQCLSCIFLFSNCFLMGVSISPMKMAALVMSNARVGGVSRRSAVAKLLVVCVMDYPINIQNQFYTQCYWKIILREYRFIKIMLCVFYNQIMVGIAFKFIGFSVIFDFYSMQVIIEDSNMKLEVRAQFNQFNGLEQCLATKKTPIEIMDKIDRTLCNLTHLLSYFDTVYFSDSATSSSLVACRTPSRYRLVGIRKMKVKGMIEKNVAAPHSHIVSLVFTQAPTAAPLPSRTARGMVAFPRLYILAQCRSCNFLFQSRALTIGSSSLMQRAVPAKRQAKAVGVSRSNPWLRLSSFLDIIFVIRYQPQFQNFKSIEFKNIK